MTMDWPEVGRQGITEQERGFVEPWPHRPRQTHAQHLKAVQQWAENKRKGAGMTLEELKTWLEARGYTTGRNLNSGSGNKCTWYAWRRLPIACRRCECNDEHEGIQVVVTPYAISPDLGGKTRESVEVELRGEFAGNWWRLTAYAFTPEQLTQRIDEIERRLVQAWQALANQ